MLTFLSNAKVWALAILIGIATIGIIALRIFAAGQKSGAASFKTKLDRSVDKLKARIDEAKKPRGEDDATDLMDDGRF